MDLQVEQMECGFAKITTIYMRPFNPIISAMNYTLQLVSHCTIAQLLFGILISLPMSLALRLLA